MDLHRHRHGIEPGHLARSSSPLSSMALVMPVELTKIRRETIENGGGETLRPLQLSQVKLHRHRRRSFEPGATFKLSPTISKTSVGFAKIRRETRTVGVMDPRNSPARRTDSPNSPNEEIQLLSSRNSPDEEILPSTQVKFLLQMSSYVFEFCLSKSFFILY